MLKRNEFKNTVAVILAAGKGKRMKSNIPKVLHQIAGRPLIDYVVSTCQNLKIPRIILIIGHKKEMVKDFFKQKKQKDLEFVEQRKLLGTGHAVLQTKNLLSNWDGELLVLCGDVPFLSVKTIKKLLRTHRKTKAFATVLTARLDDPSGYGRVVKNKDGFVQKIVEEKDASQEEKGIKEVNTGTFCFDALSLFPALERIKSENKQKEYYLTDVVEIFRKNNKRVWALIAENPWETSGINSLKQLEKMEALLTNKKINFPY
jgi:UDP-N-acetylglucosamine diphosphorylase/glucosamine-1-phosphate N-acetyltransferase